MTKLIVCSHLKALKKLQTTQKRYTKFQFGSNLMTNKVVLNAEF